MNYEMKRPLMEQIDKSLLEHASELGKMEGGPGIADVYQMKEMAEVHYYLKVEHDFKPDEVAVLLQFSDPLAVAVECWEERVEKMSFLFVMYSQKSKLTIGFRWQALPVMPGSRSS